MGHAVFIDWENIWAEHLRRAFPGYLLPTDEPSSLPTTALTPDIESLLKQVPSVMLASLADKLGAEPKHVVVAAVWHKCHLCEELGIREIFDKLGARTVYPKIDIKKVKASERKNASDFQLAVECFRSLFRPAADRHEFGKDIEARPDVDAAVFVTADHIFTILVNFLYQTTNIKVHLASFSKNVAGTLYFSVKKHYGANNIHYLDFIPPYRDLIDRSLKLDKLHAYKHRQGIQLSQVVTMTAIKRLTDASHEVTVLEFADWLYRWLRYWREHCNLQSPHTPKDWIGDLNARGFINLIDPQVSLTPPCQIVQLVREGNSTIARGISLNKKHRYVFEHLYDTPPIYF